MKRILLVISLLFCVATNAAYVVESSPGVVTAIGNLDIGGTLYNVDFEAVDDVFSTFGGNELFWAGQTSATAAILVVNNVLQNAIGGSKSMLNNHDIIPGNFTALYSVWVDPSSSIISITGAQGHWFVPNQVGVAYTLSGPAYGTAWSVAEVPVPAAIWLFLSALGLGGLVGRQKLARK